MPFFANTRRHAAVGHGASPTGQHRHSHAFGSPVRSRRRRCASFVVPLATFVLGALLRSMFVPIDMLPTGSPLLPLRPSPPLPATFLWGIFLRQSDGKRRNLIRKTMLKVDDPRLCALGAYISNVTSASGSPAGRRSVPCRVAYAFVTGGGGNNTAKINLGDRPGYVEAEGEFSDMVRLDIKENMDGGKTPTWFRMGSVLAEEYGFDYVGKSDSDSLLSVRRLLDVVESYLPSRSDPKYHPIYGGMLFDAKYCGYGLHCAALDGRVYMAGQFYFVSTHLARYASSIRDFDTASISPHDKNGRKVKTGPGVTYEDYEFGLRVSTYPGPISYLEFNSGMFWRHNEMNLKTDSGWMNVWREGLNDSTVYGEWRSWMGLQPIVPTEADAAAAAAAVG